MEVDNDTFDQRNLYDATVLDTPPPTRSGEMPNVCGRCGGVRYSNLLHVCPGRGDLFIGVNDSYPIELPQQQVITIAKMPRYKLVVPNGASIYEVNQALGEFLKWTNEVIATTGG